MQEPIQITQYALAGMLDNLTEAKTFLQKYAKGSYDNINRIEIPQSEKDCVNELFKQINFGEISYVEANRLYNLFICDGDTSHNLFASEKQFEEAICAYLTRCNIKYNSQVKCFSGIADIITDNYVIELKLIYNDSELRHAIGQVITYGLEEQYRNKRKIILFPIIPGANKKVYGNDIYSPFCKMDYSDYLEAKYDIFVCDVSRFRYIMSLDDSEINIVTGGGFRQ